MPLPHFMLSGQKVMVFKHFQGHFYGPFINTTPAGSYPISQSCKIHNEAFNFNWPSSEQAYHAQKIIHLKTKLPAQDPSQAILTAVLLKIQNAVQVGQEFLPKHYIALVEELIQTHPHLGATKFKFDELCDADFHSVYAPKKGINPATNEPYTLEFMREVLRSKFDQHPKLKETAMQLAREGILPIELSRYDNNWAAGINGSGLNMLGISILKEGNRLLLEKGETPAIPNPSLCYQNLQKRAGSQLGHDQLEPMQSLMKGDLQTQSNPSAAHRIAAPVAHSTLPNLTQGSYRYNNPNPQLATKAIYYDQRGQRVQGYYKPYRQIHSAWINATSFKRFDVKDFPEFLTPLVQHHSPDSNIQAPVIEVSSPVSPMQHNPYSKEQLIQHLKLDSNNPEHLNYWKKQVFIGGYNFKGHIIPHSLAKVFTYIETNKNTQLNPEKFKSDIEKLLSEKSNSLSARLGLSGFFRSAAVKELKEKAEAHCLEKACLPTMK